MTTRGMNRGIWHGWLAISLHRGKRRRPLWLGPGVEGGLVAYVGPVRIQFGGNAPWRTA